MYSPQVMNNYEYANIFYSFDRSVGWKKEKAFRYMALMSSLRQCTTMLVNVQCVFLSVYLIHCNLYMHVTAFQEKNEESFRRIFSAGISE